jgi:hypothetical protein
MKRATIEITENGLATIVAAVLGCKIRVISYMITTSGANVLVWKSNANAISGPLAIATTLQDGTASYPAPAYGMCGVLETISGEALKLEVGSDTTIGGYLTYITVAT